MTKDSFEETIQKSHSMKPKKKYNPNEKKPVWWTLVSKIGFWFFLISSLGFIFAQFWAGLCLLFIALLLHPKVHQGIEKSFKMRFSWSFKTITLCTILSCFVFVSEKYDQINAQAKAKLEAERVELERQQELKRIEEEKRNQQRKDSLDYYYLRSIKHLKRKRYRQAINEMTKSIEFAKEEKDSLQRKRTAMLVSARQYSKAIEDYTTYINNNTDLSENFYNRALCYLKLKKRQKAVDDLRSSMRYGNEKANKLHEKINPLRRRVAYYVTRCCDGSTSSATGRGACSHHGGVCNWNDPIYETYRKY
jgi:tetratricopeptide (TPR) repeat protein